MIIFPFSKMKAKNARRIMPFNAIVYKTVTLLQKHLKILKNERKIKIWMKEYLIKFSH